MGCMQMKENSPVCEHCGYDERSSNNTHQLPAGTIIGGQYTIGRVLGQGGFGITYMGWDNILNQRVAVKEYFPSGYAGRDNRTTKDVTSYDSLNAKSFETNKRRFLREAESLAKLWDIPQIVRVLRYFEENGTAYIAMEYVEGEDLRQFVKRHGGPLTMEEVLDVLGPVMEALTHVHQAELVHRDISPDNIMVLPEGSSKLLDFGAARYVENADAAKDRNTSTQTILKHGFAPPEQYRSHGALGPWTDVYAICATIYFCLTGKIPAEAMNRLIEDSEVGWEKVPGLTKRQIAVLNGGMTLKPSKRTQSVQELYQNLFADILEDRKRIQQEAQEKHRRKEEKERQEEARKAEEVRRAEEKRKQEEARKAEEARRAEEKRKQQEAHKAEQLRRKQTAEQKTKRSSKAIPKWIAPALAAVLAAVICISVFSGNRSGTNPQAGSTQPQVNEVNSQPVNVLGVPDRWDVEVTDLGQPISIPLQTSYEPGQICWTSDDSQVVTVLEDGNLLAAGYGVAKIFATCQEETAVCTVTVYPQANVSCTYEETAGGLILTGFESYVPADVVFPRKIDGKSVVAIDRNAFRNNRTITQVIVPPGIQTIGSSAFEGCSNLQVVYLAEGVEEIGAYAFRNCEKLGTVTVPDTVAFVDSYAFLGVPWLEGQTAEFVICGDGVLLAYRGTDANVTIPDRVKSLSSAFMGNRNIQNVTIPDSVVSIAGAAFQQCGELKHVQIPASVTSVGMHAFAETTWLANQKGPLVIVGDNVLLLYKGSEARVEIPDGVTAIASGAFSERSSVHTVHIPRSVKSIGEYAFGRCSNLSAVTGMEGVTSIGNTAFYYCANLTTVTLPQGLEELGSSAFDGCGSLAEITIPEGVVRIGYATFARCTTLSKIILPTTLRNIGDQAFYECANLSNIQLPDGLVSIGEWCFYDCRALKQVDIPQSVRTIEGHAFYGCSNLKAVTIPETVTDIGRFAFANTPWLNGRKETFVICGDGILIDYNGNETDIVIPDHVKKISSAFDEYPPLVRITIPEGVTEVGGSAFFGCHNLKYVTLPQSLRKIGASAFLYCTGLSEIIIPEGVVVIGDYAFDHCSSLKTVTIPRTCTFGDTAFDDGCAVSYYP